MFISKIANAHATATATQYVTVPRDDCRGTQITVGVDIAGGTARTCQFQIAFDQNGPWFNVGTSRTAIGQFVELIPAAPLVRLNVSANTGSTFNAWAAGN
jgi:hypothetical protein